MSDVAHRPRAISGFTLFWSDSKYDNGKDPPKVPGWQMNVRRKGENGWDCKQITDEQAQAILSMLENSGHPDGPWTVKQRETWASLDGPVLAKEYVLTCRHGRPLDQDCYACDEDDGQDGIPVGDRDMTKALDADGEKLRQLTGEDHGPWTIPDDLFAPGLYDDSLKPTYDAPEDIADFAAILANWRQAIVDNTEARNGSA